MKNKIFIGLSIGVLMLGIAATVNATPFAETGDAGESLATAQLLPGGTNLPAQ